MLPTPSREQLAVLSEAASVIGPTVTLGFAHARDDGRVQLIHSYPFGLGAYVVSEADVPDVLRPSAAGTREITSAPLKANPQRAIEWLLLSGGVERLVATRIDGLPVSACFWAGFSQPDSLTSAQRDTFERVARMAAEVLQASVAPESVIGQLRRLEHAAELLHALLHVLDVRDVFDRLSATARIALPHDLLVLRLFSEDLTRITTYARSDRGTDGGQVVPHLYPPDVVRAWEFDIVDDLTAHPVEATNPAAKLGAGPQSGCRFDSTIASSAASGSCLLRPRSSRRPTSRWRAVSPITWLSDCRTTTSPRSWPTAHAALNSPARRSSRRASARSPTNWTHAPATGA
jgi:hypothetical protein